jgi:hypothetical protein
MNALYSLYDALVSIDVPADKARAVVDAMERDMTTLLATKSDVAMLRQDLDGSRMAAKSDVEMLRRDLEGSRAAAKSDIAMVLQQMDGSRAAAKSDFALLRQDLESTRSLFSKELELLRSSILVRLGSMMVVSLGILFAALKLT